VAKLRPLPATLVFGASLVLQSACGPQSQPLHVEDAVRIATEAFRNTDTDWQLWVEVGARPIPRKMVITSKTVNSAPQYTVRVESWTTDFEPAADAFAFTPPAGATRLDPNALIDLDELLQALPSRG